MIIYTGTDEKNNIKLEDFHKYVTLPVDKLSAYIKLDNDANMLKKDKEKAITDANGESKKIKLSWVDQMIYDDASDDHKKNTFMFANINSESVTDKVTDKYDNDTLTIKSKKITLKKRTVLKDRKAITLVRQSLNLDRDSLIPLPHSHFSLSIKGLSPIEKISLEEMLVNDLTEYCSDTSGLIFSNDNSAYYKTIMEFIKPKILGHTLDIDSGEDVFDYVDIRDMNTILVYLMASLNPNGAEALIICRNSIVLEKEKDSVVCNHVLSGKILPKNMLYTNMDKITELGKTLLLRTKNSSISKEELTESFVGAEYKEETTISYQGLNLFIEFPNINRFLMSTEKFIERLSMLVEDTIFLIEDVEERKEKINSFTDLLVLNKYNHYIRKIEVEDGVIEDENIIFEILEDLVNEDNIVIEVIGVINSFIHENKISIIGVPTYTCPKCRKASNEDNIGKSFGDIIDLNPLEVFTKLRIIN